MSKKFIFTRDENGIPILEFNDFMVEDETGTPKTSPQVITNGSSLTLVIPERAARVYLTPSGNDLKMGTGAACTEYDLLLDGVKEGIGIVARENLYFKNDSGVSVTLYFKFATI